MRRVAQGNSDVRRRELRAGGRRTTRALSCSEVAETQTRYRGPLSRKTIRCVSVRVDLCDGHEHRTQGQGRTQLQVRRHVADTRH